MVCVYAGGDEAVARASADRVTARNGVGDYM
jgi:hypothetical protein